MAQPLKKIYLISDSTGELGERFANALATQFPHDRIVLTKFNFVQNEAELRKAFRKIRASRDAVLLHTVMDRKMKKAVASMSRACNLPDLDLTGPPTDFFITHLRVKPVWDVHSIHRINEEYERRIEAIEFAMGHDDGTGESTLSRAEAVLVGPSRVSKTPTSVYMAMKGYYVANIPLVREMGEPLVLERLKGDGRVWGFVISPSKLLEVRRKRVAELGAEPKNYVDPKQIAREVAWAKELYEKYAWKTVDVSDRAIEETAAIIMKTLRRPS